ncbi:hypothetical protein [Legionella worsleiensis]|uniref:Secreted protein n=1 Tax=Legionella worsleiensis TaxID=45076 RepID=A0A0W1A493_9GAMM|nr:hypothetical protein [Legionella worsleiensis]KTD76194.1 hypothetical protein Lwor_2312 [Legionella worsleiensis]STY33230.1 Uncharacterised protein [Legionella worsleiensis]
MKDGLTWMIAVFLVFLSTAVVAADIPSDVEGAQELDQMTCVDEATQDCIDDACLTSEDIDCEDKCGTLAQQKCQDEQN